MKEVFFIINNIERTFNYKHYEYLVRQENSIKVKINNSKLAKKIYSNIKESSLRIINGKKMVFTYASGDIKFKDLIKKCNILYSPGDYNAYYFYKPKKTENYYSNYDDTQDSFCCDKLLEQTYNLNELILEYGSNLTGIEIDSRIYRNSTYIEGNTFSKKFNQSRNMILIKAINNNKIYREELNSFLEYEKLERFLKIFSLKSCNINISKNYTFIFSPKIVRDLIMHIWKIYVKAISGGRVNLQLFESISDKLKIFDNPCKEDNCAYVPFDHTGKPTSEELIFDKESIKDIFIDKSDYCNVFKNNLFTRNFDISVLPHKYPTILTMNRGDIHLESYIKNTTNGVYITESSNLWQNISPEGNFEGIIDEGFIIYNGRIDGIIKGYVFFGNLYDVLGKDLIGHSNNIEEIGYYMDELPYLICRNVKIF